MSPDGTRSTLYEYAARHPAARALQGRGTAYAVPLPQVPVAVVVRHNRHGGMLARITGDRFFSPTRAPHELGVSLSLARLGVPTPEILAYALYPSGGLLQRSDVCSREIADSRDLAQIVTSDDAVARAGAFTATAELLASLARAGARHHDLNAKNVLVARETAYVLDVDRVTLGGRPEMVFDANMSRLGRSLRKWRDQSAARIAERDIVELERNARSALKRFPVGPVAPERQP